jgi:hypothetical protein
MKGVLGGLVRVLLPQLPWILDTFKPQQGAPARPVPQSSVIQNGRPIRNRPPPAEPVVYRHVNKETGKVDYIGVTNNGARRHEEHKRSGRFNPDQHILEHQPARSGASAEALYDHEKRKIKQHHPAMNQRSGGAGPRWKPQKPSVP